MSAQTDLRGFAEAPPKPLTITREDMIAEEKKIFAMEELGEKLNLILIEEKERQGGLPKADIAYGLASVYVGFLAGNLPFRGPKKASPDAIDLAATFEVGMTLVLDLSRKMLKGILTGDYKKFCEERFERQH